MARTRSRFLGAMLWCAANLASPLTAADGGGSGASLPPVPPDAAAPPTPSATAAAVAPDPGGPILHSARLDELHALIKRRTASMAESERAMQKQDRLIAALDGQITQTKAALANLQSLPEQLDAAKKAMQSADDKVASEYAQNHDYRTNLGGASQGAIDAQASAQQSYAQLKRQAADAPDQIQEGQAHLAALTRERDGAVKRRERFHADAQADDKAIAQAILDIQAEQDVMLARKQAMAGGSAVTSSATSASVVPGSPAAPSAP